MTTLYEVAGQLIARPERADFKTDWEFIRADHAFNDKISSAANEAFDKSFRKAMKRGADAL